MHTHPQTYIDVSLDHAWKERVFLKALVEIMKVPIIKVSGMCYHWHKEVCWEGKESEQLEEHVQGADKKNPSGE